MKLYLGVVPGLFPWLEEPKIEKKMKEKEMGVVISYWSFRKQHEEIISKGMHDFLSFDGSIMLDSGAYSAFNSGVNITINEYSEFLSKIFFEKNDLIVNLDVIGSSKKSFTNWTYLIDKFEYTILPVIHLPDDGMIYENENYIGLGGMVPAFKINQKGSVHDVASWLVNLFLNNESKFHGFGIGSPFHQIAFAKYLYSVDWIGWRRNAAICDCYTPEGSRTIPEARKKRSRGRNLTSDLFAKYKPPFIDSYELLHRPGTEGWKYRALWNAWWFLKAEDHKDLMENSDYVRLLKKKMQKTRLESQIINLDSFLLSKPK